MKIKLKSIKKLRQRIEDAKPYRCGDSYESGVDIGLQTAINYIDEMIADYKKL